MVSEEVLKIREEKRANAQRVLDQIEKDEDIEAMYEEKEDYNEITSAIDESSMRAVTKEELLSKINNYWPLHKDKAWTIYDQKFGKERRELFRDSN